MSVDFTGWKSGDRGVMEVEFEFAELAAKTGNTLIALSSDGSERWHDPSKIKSITRIEPPIKVGDRVRVVGNPDEYDVIGAHQDMVWLSAGYGHSIVRSNQLLERIA